MRFKVQVMDLKKEDPIKKENEDFVSKEVVSSEDESVKYEQSPTVQILEDVSIDKSGKQSIIIVKTLPTSEEEEISSDLCRLCACDLTNDKSYSIFDPSENSYYEKINFSLPITVSTDDGLPGNICENCKDFLEEVYKFTNKVVIANEVLKARFLKSKDVSQDDAETIEDEGSPQSKDDDSKSTLAIKLKPHYVCHLCGKKFRFEYLLKAHAENHKDLKSSVIPVCSFCGESFPTEKLAEAHISTKNEMLGKCTRIEHNLVDMVYKCEYCEKIFVNSNKLMYHKTSEHKFKMYACGTCNVKFTTYHKREEHKDIHVEERSNTPEPDLPLVKHYLCELCGKTYLQYEYLAAHYKIKHRSPTKTYKCQKCKEVFPNGPAISYHYKIKHNVNYFLCPEKGCYNQFTTEGALKKHLNDVHKAPVICYKCGKMFMDKPALRLHIQNNHTTSVNICEICGLTFKTIKTFENHKAEHAEGGVEKKFECVYCKKLYAYRFELQKHMRSSHSGSFRLLVDMEEDTMDQDVARSLMALRSEPRLRATKRTHQEVFLNFANRYQATSNTATEVVVAEDQPTMSFSNYVKSQKKAKGEMTLYRNANLTTPNYVEYHQENPQSENSNDQMQYCYVNIQGNRKVLLLDNS